MSIKDPLRDELIVSMLREIQEEAKAARAETVSIQNQVIGARATFDARIETLEERVGEIVTAIDRHGQEHRGIAKQLILYLIAAIGALITAVASLWERFR